MHTYMSGGRHSTPAGTHFHQPTHAAVPQHLGTSSLTHGIPYGRIVSFRLHGGARSAEALLADLMTALDGLENEDSGCENVGDAVGCD